MTMSDIDVFEVPPRTPDEVRRIRWGYGLRVQQLDRITCDKCTSAYTCRLVYDPYNVDGACLREK
jgi:hypothetical protein